MFSNRSEIRLLAHCIITVSVEIGRTKSSLTDDEVELLLEVVRSYFSQKDYEGLEWEGDFVAATNDSNFAYAQQ